MTDQKKEFLLFLKKPMLLLMPLLLLFGIPALVLLASGELVSIDSVINAQRSCDKVVMVGTAYSYPVMYYKLKSVLVRSPKVIALGDSRVMAFGSKFFRAKADFYNCGGLIPSTPYLKHFLDAIPPGKEPKVIILGLDHLLYKKTGYSPEADLNPLFHPQPKNIDFLAVWNDYFDKKFLMRNIFLSRQDKVVKIGLSAIGKNAGFINDGSYFYGDSSDSTLKEHIENDFVSILRGEGRYGHDQDLSAEAIKDLEVFLDGCRKRKIHVIGFLPPYGHIIYEKFRSMNKEYAYIFKLGPAFRPLFDKYGFGFYDFSDMSGFGSTDKELIDGNHGSQKMYLRLFLKMLEKEALLKRFAQRPEYLKGRLNNAKSDTIVFGSSEL